jgi:hypothetical protein
MVKFLLSLNVPASPVDRWGITPLWSAICEGSKEIAKVLRTHGAEIKQPSQTVAVLQFFVCSIICASNCDSKVASFLCSLASSSSRLQLLQAVLECGGFDVSSADYVSPRAL